MNKFLSSQFKTAVGLVVYNGSKYLPYTLARLAEQTAKDFFVLIIDNGSVDNSLKVIQDFLLTAPELNKRSRLVKNKKNLLFARAHNQAIQWTDSQYLLMLNQDVLLDPTYISELEKFMDTHPEAGACQGKILKWQFNPVTYRLDLHKNIHKTPVFDSGGLVITRSRHSYNAREGEFDQGQANEASEIFGVVGTVPLYRRGALIDVAWQGKVLDEDLVMYKEDVDLAWRLRLKGYKSYYVPTTAAYHDRTLAKPERLALVTKSRANWPPQLKVYSCRNHWLVLLKNDCWGNLFRHSHHIFWYELKKFIYRLFFETGVLFKAIAQFIKMLPATFAKRRTIHKTKVVSCRELRRWFV
ncbi:TPA: hypothetical protein DIC39_02575 [Patescibacteria group bacterium]|nr:MAG: Glycosyl transferase family protein [Parcubacteria group bacterium GW2011_GWA2_46_39]HCU47918.1 hypothetical protein [Patescibacteria group bacterium]